MSLSRSPDGLPLPFRIEAVQTPIIPIVAEWIRQCPGTISLGQGVVYYGPPPEALGTLEEFFKNPAHHKYQPVHGIEPLRASISSKLLAENRIQTGGASQVIVTAGGNLAFMNALLAVIDPGDEIILQRPFYFNHEMAVTLAGGKPVIVPTYPDYQLDLASIRAAITPKTRAVVTISPNNPTGAVYSEQSLAAVNELCREAGLYHISDEAYEYFTYDGASHFSPGSLPKSEAHTISLFSLSKAYGFASWRIGYMVVPRKLLDPIKKIQDTLLICPPVISQFAALGALKAGRGYCEAGLANIEQTRRLFLDQIEEAHDICEAPPAQGAFYCLLRLKTDWNAVQLAEALVRQFGVAVIPGPAFGTNDGCYLRVAYGALTKQAAAEAIQRLIRGLKLLVGKPARLA